MLGRIIEIEGEGRRLYLDRGFLAVSGPEGLLGKVPLDDIEAVILSNPAASFTSQVVAALAYRGVTFVVCDGNFRPSAYLLPVDGHHAQGDRVEAQAAAGLPTLKRLWTQVVKAKILAQAAALERHGIDPIPIRALAERLRSGDPDNKEAQAAQRYFPALFGKGFVRGGAQGANAFLNYGYTVLRAATARAIVASGLHPSLAIHHRSKGDALRLADDLMEPFRPSVDLLAKDLLNEGVETLDTLAKRRLALVLHADFALDDGVTTLSNALGRLAVSLVQVFMGERKTLLFPRSFVPLTAPADSPNDDQA
ncbi:MAG: type II CRISPR-associated endonuclease Cas1 [Beijerinckiaceae bacterium]